MAQLAFDGCRQRRGITLEHTAAALLVPAPHQHRGHGQQRRGGQHRQGHRQAACTPIGGGPADQAEDDRGADQHAQRITGPPGPPGERGGRFRHGAQRHQRRHRQAGIHHAGHQRAQHAEPGDVAGLGQAQRARHTPAHQRRAQRRLQHAAKTRQQRNRQRRQIDQCTCVTQWQVGQKGACGHAHQGWPAKHQHGGKGQASTGVDGCGKTRWQGQQQGQLGQQQVAQAGQQAGQQPGPDSARKRRLPGLRCSGRGGEISHGRIAWPAQPCRAAALCGSLMAGPQRRRVAVSAVRVGAAPAPRRTPLRSQPLRAAALHRPGVGRSAANLPASGHWHGSRPAR